MYRHTHSEFLQEQTSMMVNMVSVPAETESSQHLTLETAKLR